MEVVKPVFMGLDGRCSIALHLKVHLNVDENQIATDFFINNTALCKLIH